MTHDGPRTFATTEWSVVLAAGRRIEDSAAARVALEALCATYWYPLYAFARRQGNDADRAADMTQAFFARLVETDLLGQVDRERGRFRAFLLACMRHFLSNTYQREKALKRGGGKAPIALDFPDAESRYTLEPAHDLTAERLYARQWAMTLLRTVLDHLRERYQSEGKAELFEALKPAISGDPTTQSYAEIAASIGSTEGAIKVAVHRLRTRYRTQLRTEIARTVETATDIDAEIYALFDALA